MLAMCTGIISPAGITTDLATKNLCCTPSISHGPPSAGNQPSISISHSGGIVTALLTVTFIGVVTLFDVGGASERNSEWFTVICRFAISRMHLFFSRKSIPSMPSAAILLAITNAWVNTVLEMVSRIVTTPLTWSGWPSTPTRLL